MFTPDQAIAEITVERLVLDGNTIGVNVYLFGVPVHHAAKSTNVSDDAGQPTGPCEMWLHWGYETGRIRDRSLDASRHAIQG